MSVIPECPIPMTVFKNFEGNHFGTGSGLNAPDKSQNAQSKHINIERVPAFQPRKEIAM